MHMLQSDSEVMDKVVQNASLLQKSLSGEMNLVYWCSCNKTRACLIDCLSSSVDVSYEHFQEQVPEYCDEVGEGD